MNTENQSYWICRMGPAKGHPVEKEVGLRGKSSLLHAHWAMSPEVRLHLPRRVPFSYCMKVLYGVGLALAHLSVLQVLSGQWKRGTSHMARSWEGLSYC